MRLFLMVVLLTPYSKWVLAADPTCGDPPAVTNERVKGEVEVKANAITKILGALGFGAAYEKSREDIFNKYDDSNAARADQYLYFVVCNIVLGSTTMTDQEKLEKIETLIKMRSVMPGAPTTRPGPETGPSKRPPANTALPKGNPAQAAEQFIRLDLNPSGNVDEAIRRMHVPFCADIILSNADDLRIYLESTPDNDHGRTIVSVVDLQIISQVNFRDLRWIMHDDAAKQTVAQCLRNGIASPLDHMVTVCVRMVDLHKEVLAEVIVDRQSSLIKSVAVSATPACSH